MGVIVAKLLFLLWFMRSSKQEKETHYPKREKDKNIFDILTHIHYTTRCGNFSYPEGVFYACFEGKRLIFAHRKNISGVQIGRLDIIIFESECLYTMCSLYYSLHDWDSKTQATNRTRIASKVIRNAGQISGQSTYSFTRLI